MTSNYLLRLVHVAHAGFILSLLFGLLTGVLVWAMQPGDAPKYIESFAFSFGCLLSGGLVIGTGLFVFKTSWQIPDIIERTFAKTALAKTQFKEYKKRHDSVVGSVLASTSYVLVAFTIFYFCKFPFSRWPEWFMIAFGCIQYGILVYVGRKIYFVAHMLNSLSEIRLYKSILGNPEIAQIAGYVNIATTMTIASVYANTYGYYYGPFEFTTPLGPTAKLLLLFMVVAAAPVIAMFNFYPRVVLRIWYERSIDLEVSALKRRLADNQLTAAEFETVLIDYDRLKQAELKERLQLTLSDVPMIVAILIAVFGLLFKL